jgi:hypothetical protein
LYWQEKLKASESELPHSLRLLNEEIDRIKSGDAGTDKKTKTSIGPDERSSNGGTQLPWDKSDDGTGIRSVLLPEQTSALGVRVAMKIFIPTTSIDARKGSSRGLLLGSGGNTLRAIQNESRCKLTIKGKGSSKSTTQDTAPGTDNEEEELHVLVEYDGPASGRDQVVDVRWLTDAVFLLRTW